MAKQSFVLQLLTDKLYLTASQINKSCDHSYPMIRLLKQNKVCCRRTDKDYYYLPENDVMLPEWLLEGNIIKGTSKVGETILHGIEDADIESTPFRVMPELKITKSDSELVIHSGKYNKHQAEYVKQRYHTDHLYRQGILDKKKAFYRVKKEYAKKTLSKLSSFT